MSCSVCLNTSLPLNINYNCNHRLCNDCFNQWKITRPVSHTCPECRAIPLDNNTYILPRNINYLSNEIINNNLSNEIINNYLSNEIINNNLSNEIINNNLSNEIINNNLSNEIINNNLSNLNNIDIG